MLDLLSYLRSLSARIFSGTEEVELEKSKATKNGRSAEKYEYTNELSIKKSLPTTAEKKRVRFAETEELISQTEESNVVSVKLKMTKKQAARILSKCSDGGTLKLDEKLAGELEQIIVSNGCSESTVKRFSSALHFHID